MLYAGLNVASNAPPKILNVYYALVVCDARYLHSPNEAPKKCYLGLYSRPPLNHLINSKVHTLS